MTRANAGPTMLRYVNATLIKDGKYGGVHDFAFGLDLILDGLDRYREP